MEYDRQQLLRIGANRQPLYITTKMCPFHLDLAKVLVYRRRSPYSVTSSTWGFVTLLFRSTPHIFIHIQLCVIYVLITILPSDKIVVWSCAPSSTTTTIHAVCGSVCATG